MLIASYDRYRDVAEFDPASGRFEEFDRFDPANLPLLKRPFKGAYGVIGDQKLLIFRTPEGLWVQLADVKVNTVEESHHIAWENAGGKSTFSIIRSSDGEPVAMATYSVDRRNLAPDLTAFVDGEDADFGLFVRNAVSQRQDIVYNDEGPSQYWLDAQRTPPPRADSSLQRLLERFSRRT